MKKYLMLFIVFTLFLLNACKNNNQTLPESLQSCGNPYQDEWTIVWCDEFNYTGLPDSDKWSYDLGGHGWGNNELQMYTQREENAYVKDGHLTIAMIKEQYQNSEYTSARLVSRNKGEWQYGRVEVKAKVPAGRGTWSAIWMLPTEYKYGSWPSSGEIDIMEHVGYRENTIYGTVHTEKYNHKIGSSQGRSIKIDDATDEFHVYAIEWYPREIHFMVDDQIYFMYKLNEERDGGPDYYKAWPFDNPFHLILNIAMGGDWGGALGVDPTVTKAEMVIDYVRVYQKDLGFNDEEAPTKPVINEDKTIVTSKSVSLLWDESTDNEYVKHYEIYANDVLLDQSFSTRYELLGLEPDTSYEIKVKAVDYAGNRSSEAIYNVKTLPLPSVPGRIEAENYSELSSGNLIQSSDVDGNKVIAGIKKNDYMIYAMDVKETGNYLLKLRVASNVSNKIGIYTVDAEGNTIDYYGLLEFDRTGNFDDWQTITFSEKIVLNEGINYIKLYCRNSNVNDQFFVNWIELEK